MGNMSGSYGSHYTLWASITPNGQNIAENYTNVTVRMYLSFDGSSYYSYTNNTTSGSMSNNRWANDDGFYWVGDYSVGSLSFSSGQRKDILLAEWNDNVYHNTDGRKTFKVRGNWDTNTSRIGSGSFEASIDLQTIPRASSITATSANIEESITININKAVDYFTHTITYSFKSLSGTIATKTSNSSVGFTLPASWYNSMPDEKSSWATLTCYTYNGDTHIGTTTCTFNVYTNEAKCKPTISKTLALYDAGQTDTLTPTQTKTLTGCTDASPKFITNYSPMSITANGTAKNGAKIKQIIIAGTIYNKDATTASQEMRFPKPFGNPEVVAVDSRGYRSAIPIDAVYINYIPFTLNANIVRKRPTESEVYLTFTGNFFTGSFGSQTNALTYFLIQYKESGASSWTNGKNSLTLNTDYSLSNNQIKSLKNISLGTGFDYQKSYDFKLTMRDRLGTVSQVVIQKPVPKGTPIFNWGEDFVNLNNRFLMKGVEVFKYSNSEQEIGTWVDGKKLYRKVITLPQFSTKKDEGNYFNHNISNFSEGVFYDYSLKYQDKWFEFWAGIASVQVSSTQIIIGASEATTFSKGYFTLYYTKTT